jgi:hypothetical protein
VASYSAADIQPERWIAAFTADRDWHNSAGAVVLEQWIDRLQKHAFNAPGHLRNGSIKSCGPFEIHRTIRQRVGPIKIDLCAWKIEREPGQAHDAIVKTKVSCCGAFNRGVMVPWIGFGPMAQMCHLFLNVRTGELHPARIELAVQLEFRDE